ncbi:MULTISPECIES: NAD(P)-binding protein [Haloferax]|uniref:Potassium transporter peripheral membrane component n=1 Tax=Haloferax massiliensis TaxID=1476858 RepID=A0A0D6JSI0_9EURY|nr:MULTISPECIES: NAD(P)-binding protein [Haloferax]MDS0240476.1 NAD-binding protein [Haloferax sp. S2CR25]MDS0443597.1 NAD-binding protein [Haloferax sp. S2CR25-2]CQR50598.1 potassium transporter peripheral membrane component [Haloferax massiliensis]
MTSNHSVADERLTDCEQRTYHVLGGGHLGSAVARHLRADGRAVRVVDELHDRSETDGVRGDPADVRTLTEADVASASTVVVATASDSRNLLIAQLVRARFDVEHVVVLVNTPDRFEMFADAGHQPVCATSVLSGTLAGAV